MRWIGWIMLAPAMLAGCAGRAVDSGRTVHEDGAGGSRGIPPPNAGGGALGAGGGLILVDPPPPPPDIEPPCGAIAFNPETVPTAVLVLVDRSTDTYWDATKTALSRLIELPYVADVELALGYFGGETDASISCAPGFHLATKFWSAAKSVPLVGEAFDAPGPMSNQPLGPALEGALTYSKANALSGYRHLVLVITSREPGPCDPRDAAALSALTAAYSADVGSAVIGLGPGLSTLPALTLPFPSAAFVEGGDVAGDLLARLLEAIGKSPGCTFSFPEPPSGMEIDYDLVNVQLRPYDMPEPDALFYVRDVEGCAPNSNEGWYYDQSVDPWKIVLCGGSCARTPGGEIRVLMGCGPPDLPFR